MLPKKFLFVVLGLTLVLAGCETTPPYAYHYNPIGKPYRYGGGHKTFYDNAYDCSGSVSYVLHAIGRLETPTPSTSFRGYGESGAGRWMTIYASRGHVFLVIAGLRFDTGYGDHTLGPRWQTRSRAANGYVLRHPTGL